MMMRSTELHEKRVQYLRAIFDGFPMPAFIVDEDMHVFDFNTAAELFLGEEAPNALHQRSGEAFHCIHSEPKGCGKAEACQNCVLRCGVQQALKGRGACRQFHRAWLRRGPILSKVDLLVTTNLLPYTELPRVLMVIENLADLKKRKGRWADTGSEQITRRKQ